MSEGFRVHKINNQPVEGWSSLEAAERALEKEAEDNNTTKTSSG